MLLKASCSLSPVAPCISITKSKKSLFISARQSSKAEEKGVTGGGRWIETKAGAVKSYNCQSLQGPSLRSSSLRARWSCGYGNGVLLLFPIHGFCLTIFLVIPAYCRHQGTGGRKPALHFPSGKQLSIKTVFASAVGWEFQSQLFVGYML